MCGEHIIGQDFGCDCTPALIFHFGSLSDIFSRTNMISIIPFFEDKSCPNASNDFNRQHQYGGF